MEERAPQNECFFIRFVTFTSTLVYSVVWNQSADSDIYALVFDFLHLLATLCGSLAPPPSGTPLFVAFYRNIQDYQHH